MDHPDTHNAEHGAEQAVETGTHSSPRVPFGATHLGVLAILACVFAVLARSLDGALPMILAAVVAALVPRRHGWNVRGPIALMAALLALFVVKMWPGVATAGAEGQPPPEAGHLLSWIVFFPIASAVALLFLPRDKTDFIKGLTLALMLGAFCFTLPLLGVTMGRGYHFNENVVWIPAFGIHYHLAIDGVTLWLVLLMLEGAMLGAFLALDLFLFYVFWELMLIPMYVMIGVWGGANRIKSAIKFFLYTMFGSVLMLLAILYLAYSYARVTGAPSFDYFDLQRLLLPQHVQVLLFAAFTLAFVIKVPMFPVHTWLPDAHTEAPTAGSIILAAVMLKMGTYGYLRFSMGLFPEAAMQWAPNLAGVAVLGGIIYGALCAWKQEDVKRLIAYSSVAHLGYVMLGLFAMTQASLEGSVLQMVNHGISTGMLFLLFGVIYDRRHTRHIDEFGGLTKPMPVYAALFVVATLASVGLPGTNGFIGEFMVITGAFASNKLGRFNGVQAVGGAIGVILGAVYMLMVVQKMFFGPVTKKENATLRDINARELVAVAPLVMMIFVIGVFPNIFLSRIGGAAARVQDDFDARVTANPAPAYYAGPIRLLPARPEAPKAVPELPAIATAAKEAR